jgi:hypothetical protein
MNYSLDNNVDNYPENNKTCNKACENQKGMIHNSCINGCLKAMRSATLPEVGVTHSLLYKFWNRTWNTFPDRSRIFTSRFSRSKRTGKSRSKRTGKSRSKRTGKSRSKRTGKSRSKRTGKSRSKRTGKNV